MIRIFIGYDPRETVAFNVLSHSIQERSSEPVSIARVSLSQLRGIYTRGRDPLQSTDFSFSRFMVPYLCGYEGWAIFMDCDMLCRADIADLWRERGYGYAVQVVKHEHNPKEAVKFLGEVQTRYEKKNWSSVMLFNNSLCEALTPEYVNTASGLDLHQFKWLANDGLIGELPNRWNHLVGYDLYRHDAALAHFTSGGPWFAQYEDCEYSNEWFSEKLMMEMTHLTEENNVFLSKERMTA